MNPHILSIFMILKTIGGRNTFEFLWYQATNILLANLFYDLFLMHHIPSQAYSPQRHVYQALVHG